MTEVLEEHAVLIALIWMILANLFAFGPRRLKTPALVVMLLTWGPIVAAVVRASGWLIGFPILILMVFQMRWAGYFILRLLRSYGLFPKRDADNG